MARQAIPKRKYPTARAGNYAAPIDTAGMDPAMKATLGVGVSRPKKPSWMENLKGMFKKKSKK